MGLFSSSTSVAPPAGPDKHDVDKDEVIRSMMHELVELRQRNAELEQGHRIAVGARKSAVDRVRELEDILRLKEGLFDSLERQITLLEKQNTALQLKEAELAALRHEMEEHPVSESDLLHRYEQLAEIFDLVKDTLSCPVCYEPFQKDEAVSLMCGHTFCKPCYTSWEQRSIEAFKLSPVAGQYLGPDCPECRSADVRRGRIRIWSLEEVVRLVDRAQREIASRPYVPKVETPKPVRGLDLVAREDRLVDVEGGETAVDLPPTPASSGVPAAPEASDNELVELEELPHAAEANVALDVEHVDEQLADAVSTASSAPPVELPTLPAAETLTNASPVSDASAAAAILEAPAQDAPAVSAPGPDPFVPASADTFSIDDALPRQLLDQHAHEREQARLRALEDEARAAQEAQRARAEEEEREAREAREQVLLERRRTPYVQVFR